MPTTINTCFQFHGKTSYRRYAISTTFPGRLTARSDSSHLSRIDKDRFFARVNPSKATGRTGRYRPKVHPSSSQWLSASGLFSARGGLPGGSATAAPTRCQTTLHKSLVAAGGRSGWLCGPVCWPVRPDRRHCRRAARSDALLETRQEAAGQEAGSLGKRVAVAAARASSNATGSRRKARSSPSLGPRRTAATPLRFPVDSSSCHVGRNVAVGGVDYVHRVPLQALRRMDRAERKVIVVEHGRAGQVLRRTGRVERQFQQHSR